MHKYINTTIFLLVIVQTLLSGCSTNPVTGRNNLTLHPPSWDLQTGASQYQPSLQSQGGEYEVDEELSVYINEVGQRVAQYSPNKLPYEFTVLNNSVPNAWALPGGKIAINRGLLTELNSEAELAAVLGHEVIHSAARHGAQSQSRNSILTGVVAATSLVTQGSQYGQIASIGAGLGSQLVNTRSGRDAERESDLFGMELMSKAGYDPQGAVALQETFVRLSQNRDQDWISGLFASHPPSQERVENNKKKVTELPRGGDFGREKYQQRIAYIREKQPAYEAYEKGLAAANEGDFREADRLAQQAIQLEPKEAKFYSLRGDVAASRNDLVQAEQFYNEALQRDDKWFYLPLRRGIIRQQMDKGSQARGDLQSSLNLLSTGVGFYQ